MAHLSDRVDRIEITADCEVKMLTADGEDLHAIDKSAGASQVFTQALITAITKVSGRTFPFVVDTPLARLSRAQRIGVLKTFTDRPGQVILLSTDEEVIDDKLDAIRTRLVAAYELRVRNDKGIAVTSVHKLNTGENIAMVVGISDLATSTFRTTRTADDICADLTAKLGWKHRYVAARLAVGRSLSLPRTAARIDG